MYENVHASVVSSSIFITRSWLIFITFLSRLNCRSWHRFEPDVQNVLDVNFTRGNVDGVNVYPPSRRSELTVLCHKTHWLGRLQLEPCSQGYVRHGPILLRQNSTQANFHFLCVRCACCVGVLCGCVVLCVGVLCVLCVDPCPGPLSAGPLKISCFFALFHPRVFFSLWKVFSCLFSLSGGLLVEFWWCFGRPRRSEEKKMDGRWEKLEILGPHPSGRPPLWATTTLGHHPSGPPLLKRNLAQVELGPSRTGLKSVGLSRNWPQYNTPCSQMYLEQRQLHIAP